jgi:protein SCO1
MLMMSLSRRTVPGRCLNLALLMTMAAWVAPVFAADNPMMMHADHSMHDMREMGHSMPQAMTHQSPLSKSSGDNEHAAHHQMMHRQGFSRTVHDYAAPDLELVDQRGIATSLTEQLDTAQPVMLNFIFTTCTTICPVLTATFSQIQQELGDEALSLRMISVTIDPEQDTPESLSDYAERYQAGPQWRFLTGDVDSIIAVQKAFDIYRGSKTNHEPITLLRGAGAKQWVRIDGIASAADIIHEYHALSMAKQ